MWLSCLTGVATVSGWHLSTRRLPQPSKVLSLWPRYYTITFIYLCRLQPSEVRLFTESHLSLKVDCTSNSNICSKYQVSGYPTLKVFRDGEESGAYDGPRTSGICVVPSLWEALSFGMVVRGCLFSCGVCRWNRELL